MVYILVDDRLLVNPNRLYYRICYHSFKLLVGQFTDFCISSMISHFSKFSDTREQSTLCITSKTYNKNDQGCESNFIQGKRVFFLRIKSEEVN